MILGDYHLQDNLTDGTEIKMKISKMIIHSRYNKTGYMEYDFGLLQLEAEVSFMKYDYIRPLCLPQKNSEKYVEWNATLTAWGQTG